jgi:hypothetical protein
MGTYGPGRREREVENGRICGNGDGAPAEDRARGEKWPYQTRARSGKDGDEEREGAERERMDQP